MAKTKIENSEDLRAYFREMVTYEVKIFEKTVNFLKKTDSDRTIYSHLFSAIYNEIFDQYNKQLNEHCVDNIKEKRGIKSHRSLLDYASTAELRMVSVAIFNANREIEELKKSPRPSLAKAIAICSHAGRHARLLDCRFETGDFEVYSYSKGISNAKQKLSDLDSRIEQNDIKMRTYSIRNQKIDNYFKNTNTIKGIWQDTLELLIRNGVTRKQDVYEILLEAEKGFYQTNIVKKYPPKTVKNIEQYKHSEEDLKSIQSKLFYTYFTLEKCFEKAKKPSINLLKDYAFEAGRLAREFATHFIGASPEFLASFLKGSIKAKQEKA